MICVSISDPGQIGPAVQAEAELIELRLDLLRTRPADLYARLSRKVKTVITCRPGHYTDEERIGLIKEAVELGANYVDIELESSDAFIERVMSITEDQASDVIISYHNFEITPGREELNHFLDHCFDKGGNVAKIATMVRSRSDIMNLFSLYNLPGRKIVLGMGDAGRITRVVAPYLGSEFTFASTGSGDETAPGQLEAAQLQAIYKAIDES